MTPHLYRYHTRKLILIMFGVVLSLVIVLYLYVKYAECSTSEVKSQPVLKRLSVKYLDGTYGDYTTGSGDTTTFITDVSYDSNVVLSTLTEEYKTLYRSVRGAHQSLSTKDLINLSEPQAWNVLTSGVYTEYPKGSYRANAAKIKEIRENNSIIINVPVWTWEHPDTFNLTKVSKRIDLEVNKNMESIWNEVFLEIYEDPTKPVINVSDKGMGTWVTRGKNHNPNNTMSSHSLGTAIDINPSTASVRVEGTVYGNGYGQKVMTLAEWEKLPDLQAKYNMLHAESPIVQIMKAYGFCWGGDWKDTPDPMHFSFIGDGANAREVGVANYNEYKNRGE